MHNRKIIVISSFVPAHNKSPVAVNKKMLRLCSEIFDNVIFLTANFPENAFECHPLNKVQLYNLPADFSKNNSLWVILNYIKMQIASISVIRQNVSKDVPVMFWLSGPMIIPFLYCKIRGFHTIGFLYGNSKYKSSRHNPLNLLKSHLMRYIVQHADVACVEAPGVLTQWGYLTNNANFQTVHLFADTNHFLELLPPSERPPIIGMCCRLVPNKRVLESIEAFHILRQKHPEYHLEIVGSGPLDEACRQRIVSLGEEEFVKMVGWVNSEDLPKYYNNWRILLHPTNYEGLPNSLIEAMCCSTPALASAVGGVVDVIQDKKNGWFLCENTATGIAGDLENILRTDDWISVAKSAGKFARQEYCYTTALKTLQKVCCMIDKRWQVNEENC